MTERFLNPVIYKAYVGVADKTTPHEILEDIKDIAVLLNSQNYVLRSSKMNIAEDTFIDNTEKTEIFLPWKGFHNDHPSKINRYSKETSMIAGIYNPVFDTLTPQIKAMIVRDISMVLGAHPNSHAKFVVCWTPDGAERLTEISRNTGFLNTIIRVASSINIPVFNLFKQDAKQRLGTYINNFNYRPLS